VRGSNGKLVALDISYESEEWMHGEWAFGEVIVYENRIDDGNLTNLQVLSTFTHEFGHALCLIHSDASVLGKPLPYYGKSVMARDHLRSETTGALVPQEYDKLSIRNRWGN
jgi:hypothetical protein